MFRIAGVDDLDGAGEPVVIEVFGQRDINSATSVTLRRRRRCLRTIRGVQLVAGMMARSSANADEPPLPPV